VHPERVQQISIVQEGSATPRDLTEDKRTDQILKSTEQFIKGSKRARNTSQRNRVDSLPHTKRLLDKTQKAKQLQEAEQKREVVRNERLREIIEKVLPNLSKE
jgi:hypothetical protein